MVGEYQKVKLRDGRAAVIMEVPEAGVAYLADIYDGKGDYDHEQISHSDIVSLNVEVERPLCAV